MRVGGAGRTFMRFYPRNNNFIPTTFRLLPPPLPHFRKKREEIEIRRSKKGQVIFEIDFKFSSRFQFFWKFRKNFYSEKLFLLSEQPIHIVMVHKFVGSGVVLLFRCKHSKFEIINQVLEWGNTESDNNLGHISRKFLGSFQFLAGI